MKEAKTPAARANGRTPGAPGQVCTLPLLGPTTVEDIAFYGVLGVVTAAELVAWPTAALIGSAHALHQRARFVLQTQHLGGTERAEILEGTLEVSEEVL